MIKGLKCLLIILLLTSCVEPYEFLIRDDSYALVVEGYISNVSAADYLTQTGERRYFTIKLHYTSDVSNIADEPINDANVELQSSDGSVLHYEKTMTEGEYSLMDTNFNVEESLKYKLKITLRNDDSYESDWITYKCNELGDFENIAFEETEIDQSEVVAGSEELVKVKGVNVMTDLHVNPNAKPVYYLWKFDATWIYKAPLVGLSNPYKTCWAKNSNFLNKYVIAADNDGGYSQKLFFLPTIGNEKVYEDFSVLITQQVLSEESYFYIKEIQEQTSGGAVSDKPPYNVISNLTSNDGKLVLGHFDVVSEQFKRWYFNGNDVSYGVYNDLADNCYKYAGRDGPALECFSCLEYSNGEAALEEPSWWDPVH